MAASVTQIRKKRNFKGLGLDVTQPTPEPEPLPILPRAAPSRAPAVGTAPATAPAPMTTNGQDKPQPSVAPKKKRPGPLTLGAPKPGIGAPGGSGAAPAANNSIVPNAAPAVKTHLDESGMLTIPALPNSAPATGTPSASPFRSNYQNTLTQQLEAFSLGQVALKAEDLKEIGDLGSGNGGSVKKVTHLPTGTNMAKKIVFIDAKPAVRKQILRELQILHACRDSHIVSFYGAFVTDPNVCICMEYMDKGSLDSIYKRSGPIPIDVVGKIAFAVLSGLTYLYDEKRIIHRDIKPSNMLVNSQGEIKIADFGVSGELINSIADTFVGTSTYMSPERIQGAQYTVKSDVWSTGISLIELALGRFPFSESSSDDSDLDELPPPGMMREKESINEDLEATLSPSRPGAHHLRFGSLSAGSGVSSSGMGSLGGLTVGVGAGAGHHASMPPPPRMKDAPPPPPKKEKKKTDKKDKRKSKGVSLQGGGMTMSILELLQHIVNEPAPRLGSGSGLGGRFPLEAEEFVDKCLLKDPDVRPTPKELLKHRWIAETQRKDVDLVAWAATI